MMECGTLLCRAALNADVLRVHHRLQLGVADHATGLEGRRRV